MSRSGLYYQPVGENPHNLQLMRMLDEQYSRTPYCGVRRMTAWLKTQREEVNKKNQKRVARLMNLLGLETLYPRPRTTVVNPALWVVLCCLWFGVDSLQSPFSQQSSHSLGVHLVAQLSQVGRHSKHSIEGSTRKSEYTYTVHPSAASKAGSRRYLAGAGNIDRSGRARAVRTDAQR